MNDDIRGFKIIKKGTKKSVRKLIGWLGLTLGWFLWLLEIILTTIDGNTVVNARPSISDYYHAGGIIRIIFMATLIFIGIVLILYKGHKGKRDDLTSIIGGIASITVAVFPTSPQYATPDQSGIIHYISAVIFLGAMGVMLLFNFSQSSYPIRNKIFKVLGILVIFFLVLIALDTAILKSNLTYWFENFAVTAFALGWFLKGSDFLKPK
ncbi:MAG: DUF998 domain-containing protein [Candidatus Heimdallarchaeota archaeon]|nr:DUF998 domain-containing protein [Candidatus Heimdallarchaeota archaeon]MDH5646095.1 DUF998 domain-containing protein [Candidatus Heimdallarchaeota archaeon]